eukprot:TRINITY_DN95671_c0_g1_i1.p1 TRINITY_DN95671_c0_g1~~TRINITY_DN95671_c0_g1_i1.p1  ORF type:complete len:200 (-),score=54.58 TRINITY_DN95671_c0_g1_i1:98-697(-)
MPPTTALDLVHGITQYSSRIALKQLFSQFGEVSACWIPPLDHRAGERAYVKFASTNAAQAALDAANNNQLFLDGVCLRAEWRMAASRTQDTRDFDARGSNLMTSRDLMRAAMKARLDRKDKDKDKDKDRKKDRDRSRDRDRKRRSRSREKRRRDKSRSKSAGDRRSRSRSRKKSRSKEKEQPVVVAIEDAPASATSALI